MSVTGVGHPGSSVGNAVSLQDGRQSRCQSTSQYQKGLWRSHWIRNLT